MERILKQRDRLLAGSARLVGLAATAIALMLLALPGSLPTIGFVATLPFFAALLLVQWLMGASHSLVWPIFTVVASIALIIVVRLAAVGMFGGTTPPGSLGGGPGDAVRIVAAASAGSAAVLLTVSLGRMLILVGAFSATMIAVAAVFSDSALLAVASLSTVAGWVGLVTVGSVLSAGLLRAARRISNIGRAHRMERQASETEAQRRQGARLLHDTVLATLTLLAHSGVGVSRDAMRRQAADDARLLRQLRLSPAPIGGFGAASAAQSGTGDTIVEAGDTLDSVKQRVAGMGLTVNWHGNARVSLDPARRDAFLLALSECLENVRRHAGVDEAHVTVTEDETTVRALVTDNGVGFDPDAVAPGKLGYRESIVARLRDVGGNARVFSSKGSGTTVVLEVPR